MSDTNPCGARVLGICLVSAFVDSRFTARLGSLSHPAVLAADRMSESANTLC
jgi:hypothetical protein